MAWRFEKKNLIVAAVVLGLVFIPLLLNSYWMYFLCLLGITIILSTSMNLAMGYTGMVSMVHTGLYAIGGYFSGIMVVRFGLPFAVALVGALVFGLLLGFLISLTATRASSMYFAMITMAFNTVLQEWISEWGTVTGGFAGLSGIPRPRILGGAMNTTQFYYLVLILTLIIIVVFRNLVNSKYGRAFKGIMLNEQGSAALGIRPNLYKALSFAIAGGMASFAGTLYAHLEGFVSPELMSGAMALTMFVALMMGGSGTILGPILGVTFVMVMQRLIAPFALYQALIFGLVLLGVIYLFPKGLIGIWEDIMEWRKEKTKGATEKKVFSYNEEELKAFFDENIEAYEQGDSLGDSLSDSLSGTAESVLRLVNVSKSFGGVQALKNVSMDVRTAAIHGLIGPNGSGKSTLINVISGTLSRDEGEVYFRNEKLNHPSYAIAQKGVGRVFQIPHLFDKVTVMHNLLAGYHMRMKEGLLPVLLGLPQYRRCEKETQVMAKKLIDLAGLSGLEDMKVAKLSHGQKRMLELIRAIMVNPRLLMLDEPATGLSALELENLAELIKVMRDRGISVLLIEHNMRFVMNLCDTITVLEEGEVISEGTPAEVKADPRVLEAYIGTGGVLKSDKPNEPDYADREAEAHA